MKKLKNLENCSSKNGLISSGNSSFNTRSRSHKCILTFANLQTRCDAVADLVPGSNPPLSVLTFPLLVFSTALDIDNQHQEVYLVQNCRVRTRLPMQIEMICTKINENISAFWRLPNLNYPSLSLKSFKCSS